MLSVLSPVVTAIVVPWLAASGGLVATPRLQLIVFSSAGVSETVLDNAQREVDAILADAGIVVEWIEAGEGGVPVPTGALHIKVDVLEKDPARWRLPANAMGVTFVNGVRPDTMFVFMPAVRATVNDPRFPVNLGQAVGRVIVHELVHVLDPSRPHTDDGIMAPRQKGAELYGRCLELDRISSATILRRCGAAGPMVGRGRGADHFPTPSPATGWDGGGEGKRPTRPS